MKNPLDIIGAFQTNSTMYSNDIQTSNHNIFWKIPTKLFGERYKGTTRVFHIQIPGNFPFEELKGKFIF